MELKNYRRTDLALELQEEQGDAGRGIDFTERQEGKVTVSTLTVKNKEGAELLGKPVGRYVTLSFGKPWLFSEEERQEVSNCLAAELKGLFALAGAGEPSWESGTKGQEEKEAGKESGGKVGKASGRERTVLVVGLGNRRMTADAVGPGTLDKITVTRHVKSLDPALFRELGRRTVAAMAPGVLGDTGMESAEMVRAVVKELKPCALLAVDALAARSVSRLATTIQLCDTGISPGAGVGNDRPALNREYMGVPVIALGVPMVVDSSTLVTDMLEMAGVDPLPEGLEPVLKNGRSFFVSLKEADAALEALTDLLAEGIDLAMEAAG